jgi:hypothetical protein
LWNSSPKPASSPRRDRRVVALAPALQRLGIIEAEPFAVLPAQAALARQRFELRLVEQHAAGEDIGLDEVGLRA